MYWVYTTDIKNILMNPASELAKLRWNKIPKEQRSKIMKKVRRGSKLKHKSLTK